MTLIPGDLDVAMAELERRREPYALATVVWTKGLSSGKAGDRAVVTTDGKLRGWVGGACALGKVIRQCQEALAEREPRVLCIGHDDVFPERDDGRINEPASCQSDGSYEIFIEPKLPAPRLFVFGDAPVATTLGTLARAVGFEITAVRRAVAAERPEAHHVVDANGDLHLEVDADDFVVVATMGQWDRAALEAALSTPAHYVALVASPRRWGKLRPRFEAQFGSERIAAVRAPAGLDLGPVDHPEIAVAVLAEVVREKALRRPRLAGADATQQAASSCGRQAHGTQEHL